MKRQILDYGSAATPCTKQRKSKPDFGGGVALLVKEGITHTLVEKLVSMLTTVRRLNLIYSLIITLLT